MSNAHKERRGLRWTILGLKLAATVGLFLLLFYQEEFALSDLVDELEEIRKDLSRFVVWALIGVAIKLVGIFANIRRWQLLLRGQELWLDFKFLCGSFFVGRFFGIVTPGTLGLDGFKLYDSIRVTRRPVECSAVIVIDKVVGLVSLASLLLVVFPLGWSILPGFDRQTALVVGLVSAAMTAVFFTILLAPSLTRPLLRLVPAGRLRDFGGRVFEAATAYANHRKTLLSAVGLAVVGHLTTALMYWALLTGMSKAGAGGPSLWIVLFAALVMTAATLVGPTVGGEGIREYVFAKLLMGFVQPARSVLFGHAGFWIEKGLLGLPGGLIYLVRRSSYDGPVTRADLDRLRAEVDRETATPG